MSEALARHIEGLKELFRHSRNKHEAHFRSQDILKEMASDPSVLAAVFETYLVYPGALTITLALWSHRSRTSWKDRVKRLPFLKGREKVLRELGVRLGLARALDLKVVHYFDFCPSADGFRGLRERTEFAHGPNEDFLFSLFHVLQQTGQLQLAARIESRLSEIENRGLVETLLHDLRDGRAIEGRLSEGHFGQASANFTPQEIARALASY